MSLNRDSQGRQSVTFLTCINLDDVPPLPGKQNYPFFARDMMTLLVIMAIYSVF
jgi:hypothetical protein